MNNREWCWPMWHDWGPWTDKSAYEKSGVWKNVYEMGIVQERRCKRCNQAQRRLVADKG